MRTGWIVASGTAALTLGLTLGAPPAHAAGKQVDQITCEEFLALNPNDQQRIAYWVDGYQMAKGEAANWNGRIRQVRPADWQKLTAELLGETAAAGYRGRYRLSSGGESMPAAFKHWATRDGSTNNACEVTSTE